MLRDETGGIVARILWMSCLSGSSSTSSLNVQKQPLDRRTGNIRPVSSQNSQEYVHDEAALREKRATLHQGPSHQEMIT
jgi:hypothetical protein